MKSLITHTTTQPTVESLTDYYPFGMAMPGRSYNASPYRFGYTGHEKEGDLAEGVYTTQYRLLDTRLGRWMSVDPLFGKYPDMGAYGYCGGNPVGCWDPDGRYFNKKGERKVQYIEKKIDRKIEKLQSDDPKSDLTKERVKILEDSKRDFEEMRNDTKILYKFKYVRTPFLSLPSDLEEAKEIIIHPQYKRLFLFFLPRTYSFLHESKHGGDVARRNLTQHSYTAKHEVDAYRAELSYDGVFKFDDASKPKSQQQLQSEITVTYHPVTASPNNSDFSSLEQKMEVQTHMPSKLYNETTITVPSMVNEDLIKRIIENNKPLYDFK